MKDSKHDSSSSFDSGKGDLLDLLKIGVNDLKSSENFKEFLKVQSIFKTYSFSNTVLIFKQMPTATNVAGFNAWKRLGRQVIKGEKAIRILAPIVERKKCDLVDSSMNKSIKGFRSVSVFDISQTEGKDLPQVIAKLEGDDILNLVDDLTIVAAKIGFKVVSYRFNNDVNGDCDFHSRTIRLEETNGGIQKIKTLSHELAHALNHENASDRATAELEAEAIAFVFCSYFGIDTSMYSFGYIASWSNALDNFEMSLKASGRTIQKTANYLIDEIICKTVAA